MNRFFSTTRLFIGLGVFLVLLAFAWLFYGLFGYHLIEAMYKSDSIALFNRIMAGRETTPLQDYYARGDRFVILGSLRLITLILALTLIVALIKKPLEIALACSSFILFSFLLFSTVEAFPFLIKPLQLNKLAYYRSKISKIPDNTLGFRHRPSLSKEILTYEGLLHSRLYGIKPPPRSVEWETNKEGFRGSSDAKTADIVLIGDSFIEYGNTEAELFGKLLERHLPGLTVANLGISGYGPFQYLEVLKRYAIKKKPKLAFFCFYEANDIWGIGEYLKWVKHGTPLVIDVPTSKNFFERYRMLMAEVLRSMKDGLVTAATMLLAKITQPPYIHPDVAVLRLPNGDTRKIVLIDRHDALSTEEMLRTKHWQALRNILLEFKKVSDLNGIRPMILYIPMIASIYAEYTTQDSGKNWREVRAEQVSRMKNMENAMLRLSGEVGIELVDISDAYRKAAKAGRMLYDPIDAHWNLEGREIAAEFVAAGLKSKSYASPGRVDH